MNYDKIRNILEKNKFLAHTVKRNGSRLTYSYFSVPYYAVKIEIEDFKEFMATLGNLHKIHNKERIKLFK